MTCVGAILGLKPANMHKMPVQSLFVLLLKFVSQYYRKKLAHFYKHNTKKDINLPLCLFEYILCQFLTTESKFYILPRAPHKLNSALPQWAQTSQVKDYKVIFLLRPTTLCTAIPCLQHFVGRHSVWCLLRGVLYIWY